MSAKANPLCAHLDQGDSIFPKTLLARMRGEILASRSGGQDANAPNIRWS
jgi:hypothetical protein